MQNPKIDLVKHPRFYFFDTGVYNALAGGHELSLDRIGYLTEQTIFSQLLHSGWAQEKKLKLNSFRTRSGVEVDFIAELDKKIWAIEVKNSDSLDPSDCDALNIYKNEVDPKANLRIFHFGTKEKKWGPVWSLPWQKGLKEMGL